MTAANLFVGSEAAYLLFDCASYRLSDKVVTEIGGKIDLAEHLNVAIGHEGCVPPFALARLRKFLVKCRTQADFLKDLPQLAVDLGEQTRSKISDGQSTLSHFFVAMYSTERNRAEGYTIPLYGRPIAQSTEIHVRPCEFSQLPLRAFRQGSLNEVRAAALALIELQRKCTDNRGYHYVGGAAELVAVGKVGIHREIIRRWRGDRIGRRIRPGWLDRLL